MGSKIPKIDPRMRQIGTSGVHFQNDDQGAPGVLNLQRTSISNYHQSYGTFSPTSWALRGLQLHACYRLTSRGETPRTPPYPLLSDGIIYDTIPPKMSWGDWGVLRGRSKGFSEALSSFLGSPGNKNRFFRSHSTPRGKAQTKIQPPPPLSSSLLLLRFLAVRTVQFR